MVSEFSNFAITGYINTKAPPEVVGSITGMLYWYEGLAEWVSLTDTPPTVPMGTAFHLAVQWLNQTAESISGHIQLIIIKPDGSEVTPADVLNQNNWAAPGNEGAVQFEPVVLDQIGEYQAKATLSSMGQILDERTYAIAEVTALVEITSIVINPTSLTDLYHEYQTSFGIGYCGEPFTISLTFRNPHDYDVWLAPDFAFGNLTGEPLEYVGERELMVRGFNPAPVLYYPLFLESEYIWGDYSYSGATWYELWQPGHAGSNMTQYVYDPEGIPLVTGAQAWLKVPAKGQATTRRQCNLGVKAGLLTSGSLFGWTNPYGWVWKFYNNCVPGQEYLVKYVKSSDRPFDPTKPMDAFEVYGLVPRVFDICAVATGFYIVHEPGYGTFQGKPVNYRKVTYEPLASAIEAMVEIAAFHGDYERDGTVYTFRWQKYIGTVDATQLKFEDAPLPSWW